MSDAGLRSIMGISLSKRIQATVFTLTLSSYLIGLVLIGLPLREMTVRSLYGEADREVSALAAALQDHALLRDYPAIEQTLLQRVSRSNIQRASFKKGSVLLDKMAPQKKLRYPDWFARVIAIAPLEVRAEIHLGGVNYGTVSLVQGALGEFFITPRVEG
jgi:hypothetical protein